MMSDCIVQPWSEATTAENFTHLNKDALELKITQLSADINAATCEQVLLMAEFDTRQAWGQEGLRSCAHWLNWRCGISFGAAREKIRVGQCASSTRLQRTGNRAQLYH